MRSQYLQIYTLNIFVLLPSVFCVCFDIDCFDQISMKEKVIILTAYKLPYGFNCVIALVGNPYLSGFVDPFIIKDRQHSCIISELTLVNPSVLSFITANNHNTVQFLDKTGLIL